MLSQHVVTVNTKHEKAWGALLRITFQVSVPSKPNPQTPALILCHPFTNSSEYWAPQLEDKALSEKYIIVAVDAPGHGLSPTYQQPWNFWDFSMAIMDIVNGLTGGDADITPPLRDEQRAHHAVIAGDSMGGFTALRAALTDSNNNIHKLSGICVVASTGGLESTAKVQEFRDFSKALASTASEENPQKAIRTLADAMIDGQYGLSQGLSVPDELKEWGTNVIFKSLVRACAATSDTNISLEANIDELAATLSPKQVGDQILANFQSLLGRDTLLDKIKQKGSIKAPVLIIHGDTDDAYPLADNHHGILAETIRESGGQVELEIWEKTPHFCTATHALRFNKRLDKFLHSLS